jgi:predicted amino acid racemase/arginase family enzyme
VRHPFLDIDLDKIEHNCRAVTDLCRARGIEVAGVTKVVCGLPKVARAMLRGGAAQLADSRLENIARIRDDGIRSEIMMLRIPRLSDAETVVELAEVSLNSEIAVIRALSEAARGAGRKHKVVLMVDTGDLREGVLPRDALALAEQAAFLPGIELHGVGTNLACFGGIQPTRDNMNLLVEIAEEIRARLSLPLPMVSGGNSFNLPLVESGEMPAGVNHLRLGSSIMMGLLLSEETRRQIREDAFLLHAEILELKDKPSVPHGERGEDAFGHRPEFQDRGTRRRAILGIGREDIVPEYLVPTDAGAEVLGASSDHLILDVTDVERELSVGGEMVFDLDYGAVLAAMTSRYVHKNLIYTPSREDRPRGVRILGVPDPTLASAPREIREQGLGRELLDMGIEVVDGGDLAGDDLDAALADAVGDALLAEEIPVVLGGPHAVLHGELAGITRLTSEFGLICFDAHGDLVTTITSVPGRPALTLGLENFVLVGVRDLSGEERRLLSGSPITVFTMEDVDRRGMVEVMEEALNVALAAVEGLHVSIDVDFVDAAEAPGAVEPEPGGISYREAHLAMEMIAETRRLISADLAELDPARDPAGRTARLGVSLLASLLGRKLLARES